jgi:hypothetical protein
MLLFEGISVWPTMALRLASFVLCVTLIFRSLNCLDRDLDEIAKALRLDKLRHEILAEGKSADRDRGFWAKRRDTFSLHLREPASNAPGPGQDCHIANFWRTYAYRGRKSERAWRAFVCVLIMFGFSLVLVPIFGGPNDPARGDATRIFYVVSTMLDVIATWFLIFLVGDATVFSCIFVRELRKVRSVWPKQSRQDFQALLALDEAAAEEWLDVQFVAMRTRCIMGLIYYPFIMMALLIVSRSSAFDSFAANPTLIITQGVSLAVVVGCVIWLRWEAEQIRKTASTRLTDMLIATRSGAQNGRKLDQRVTALKDLINRVESLRDGAFIAFSQQPMVRALLVPLGTYGGTYLLEYLTGS